MPKKLLCLAMSLTMLTGCFDASCSAQEEYIEEVSEICDTDVLEENEEDFSEEDPSYDLTGDYEEEEPAEEDLLCLDDVSDGTEAGLEDIEGDQNDDLLIEDSDDEPDPDDSYPQILEAVSETIEMNTGLEPAVYTGLLGLHNSFAIYGSSYDGCFGNQLKGNAKDVYDIMVDVYVNNGNTKGMDLNYSVSNTPYTFEAQVANNTIDTTTEEYTEARDKITDDVQMAMDALANDYPEEFWWRGAQTTVQCSGYADATSSTGYRGYIYAFKFTPTEAFPGAAGYISEFDQAVTGAYESIMSDAGTDLNQDGAISDYEYISAAHGYVCEHLAYNMTKTYAYLSNKDYRGFCAAGMFINDIENEVVCEGYAKSFKVLCDAAGIKCALIAGRAGGGDHMWNAVMCDGKWYFVDTTWDDTAPVEEGQDYTSDYLLAGDQSTHTADGDFSDTDIFCFAFPVISETAYVCGQGHTWDAGTIKKDSTCSETGICEHTCTACTKTKETTIALKEHQFENHRCTVCGEFEDEIYSDIANAQITVATGSIFTGAPLKPLVSVNANNVDLEEDKDYTLVYANNTNAGTGTVTIKGTGDYHGSKTFSFAIAARTIATADFDAVSDQVYTGSEIIPELMLSYNGMLLEKEKDYNVILRNNVKPGQASLTILGTGNYRGSKILYFTIAKKDISELAVPVIEGQQYRYDGCTPDVSLTYGDISLEEGTDYSVRYLRNKAIGTGYAVADGMGSFEGSLTIPFTIGERSISADMVEALGTEDYDGEKKTPQIRISDGSYELEEGTDYSVSYGTNINAGSGSVTITGMGNYKRTFTMLFKIRPRAVSNAGVIFDEDAVFDNNILSPEPVLTDNGKTLAEGTDYTVTYEKDGEDIVASFTGMGNYNGSGYSVFKPKSQTSQDDGKTEGNNTSGQGGSTATKVIHQVDIKLAVTTYLYDGKAKKPAATVYVDGKVLGAANYTLSYSNNKKVGLGTVTATGKGSYSALRVSAEFGIVPKAVKIKSAKRTSSKKVVLTWKIDKQVSGYEIQFSTSSKFAASKTKTITVSAKKTKYTYKKLKNRTYYIRIRGIKKAGSTTLYGNWSSTKKIKK